jgi:hypothetical protein
MASETNELTFVRCPTCRSLVPASASKCRICNATLDAGAKGSTADTPPSSSGRVRQKTVSAESEEVKSIVATSSSSTPPDVMPVSATSSAPPRAPGSSAAVTPDEEDTFDPLGAFLQDLDAVGEKTGAPSEEQAKSQDESLVDLFDDADDISDEDNDDNEGEEDDLEEFDLDIFDDPYLDDPLADPLPFDLQPEEPKQEPVAPQSDATLRDAPRAVSREIPRETPRAPEARKPQNRDPQPPAPRESQAQQSVQSARSSQSQIRPRIGGMPFRGETKPPAATTRMAADESKPAVPRGAEGRRNPAKPAQASQPEQARPQPTANVARGKPEANAPRPQTRPGANRPSQVLEHEEARLGKMRAGRLFGWLVSYEHPDGRAIELRAGRFFVTGTSIRSTDLILEDQSISTPHALMAITENGLQLQDLMSERGTFVRCQGEAQYTREEGVIEVRHGDWIRFGDVEFLVTIVPS